VTVHLFDPNSGGPGDPGWLRLPPDLPPDATGRLDIDDYAERSKPAEIRAKRGGSGQAGIGREAFRRIAKPLGG
jgi:hypothetical protein